MKIIINTANLLIGGALQRSVSFLQELEKFTDHEYFIFCTSQLSIQLDWQSFPDNFTFYHFDHSPASLKYRREIVKQFNIHEQIIKPDIVFSFVGPAYWRPKSTHLVGFGIPHIVYSDYPHVKKIGLKTKLEMIYKQSWTKKEADYYVVQTEDVKKRLAKKIKVSESKIFIVSNGYGSQYKDSPIIKETKNRVKKLLLISAFRDNKNIEIIKKVIPELIERKFQCEFHLTINAQKFDELFAEDIEWVKNHGPVPSSRCPELYNQCDAMFLPTLLECFSASYPEAMKMQKPILTSDLSFARSVCEDAALYFNPFDPKDIAEKIIALFRDQELQNQLVSSGIKKLELFPSPKKRAEQYLQICKQILSH